MNCSLNPQTFPQIFKGKWTHCLLNPYPFPQILKGKWTHCSLNPHPFPQIFKGKWPYCSLNPHPFPQVWQQEVRSSADRWAFTFPMDWMQIRSVAASTHPNAWNRDYGIISKIIQIHAFNSFKEIFWWTLFRSFDKITIKVNKLWAFFWIHRQHF